MTKKKLGRPGKLASVDLEQVAKLAALGLTDAQMAAALKIAVSSLYEYKKNPAFSEAIKAGKAESDAKVERSLYERALGYSVKTEKIFCTKFGEIVRAETVEHYPPDPTSMIFWLKNRKPQEWRDKQEVEHGTKDGAPLVVIHARRNPYLKD